MLHHDQFYIGGSWVRPFGTTQLDVINPATEQPFTQIILGEKTDVDVAVAAARDAFSEWSMSTRAERLVALRNILEAYNRRAEDLAQAISAEMGSPIMRARDSQVWAGKAHLEEMIATLERYSFEERRGDILVSREAVGVCGLITPWNWPMNQIVCKVAPAIAAGCTMVLKPSEIAPLSAIVFSEIMDASGLPAGVFNMIHGTGPVVGAALAGHPDIDMISLTGSTRAGAAVAHLAADSIKRVHQELGGKSPNIILPHTNLDAAVRRGVAGCFSNSGQSCDAPTRMLVPRDQMQRAMDVARETAEAFRVGSPEDLATQLGPVVSHLQYERIQTLIAAGIDEGAILVTGGLGKPLGLETGYYVRPTVFAGVNNAMTIAREEIFGPVLCILGYETEEEAVAIANDTPYGLAAYVQSNDLSHANAVARRLRAGNVTINGAPWTVRAPFGGFGRSGNGRECSDFGLTDFLELKAVIGYGGSNA